MGLISHIGFGGNTTSSSINTTGSSILFVAIWGGATLPTFTDNKSNTWYVAGTVNNCALYAAYGTISVGSGHTVTTTGGHNTYQSFLAFSGFTGPVDKYSTDSQGYSSSVVTGPITPSTNGCLIMTIGYLAVLAFSSVSVPFSPAIDTHTYSGDYYSGGVASAVQGTAIAISATWTPSGSNFLNALIASYPASGGVITSGSQSFALLGVQ